MVSDTPEGLPVQRLRERLQARGAKPHSRMSDLSRYMLAHRDELRTLLADGFAWADIAALLADEEKLTDEAGRAVTAGAAKLAWSRLNRRDRTGPAAPRSRTPAAPPPDPDVAVPEPQAAPSPEDPAASQAMPLVTIQPARPRNAEPAAVPAATPPTAPVQPSLLSSALLSDQEINDQLAKLANSQGGPKLPTPKPL